MTRGSGGFPPGGDDRGGIPGIEAGHARLRVFAYGCQRVRRAASFAGKPGAGTRKRGVEPGGSGRESWPGKPAVNLWGATLGMAANGTGEVGAGEYGAVVMPVKGGTRAGAV